MICVRYVPAEFYVVTEIPDKRTTGTAEELKQSIRKIYRPAEVVAKAADRRGMPIGKLMSRTERRVKDLLSGIVVSGGS